MGSISRWFVQIAYRQTFYIHITLKDVYLHISSNITAFLFCSDWNQSSKKHQDRVKGGV